MGQARRQHSEDAAPGFAPLKRGPKTPHRAHVMYADELAERLAICKDTLCRTRGRLQCEDGMPPPLSNHRPLRWNRVKILAWLNRDADLPAAANDLSPPAPTSIEQDRVQLQAEYGARARA